MNDARPITVRTLASCASTQEEARAMLAADPAAIALVRSDSQQAGRGRRARTWHDPPGAALMLSVGLRGALHVDVLEQLVRRIVDALHEELCATAQVPHAAITWSAPNDLVDAVSGAKLAGVLVDATSVGERVEQLLVGLGVNIGGDAFDLPGEERRCATLEAIAGRTLATDAAALDELALRVARRIAALVGVTPVAAPRA